MHETDEYRIALGQNIAANGRLFCALLVGINAYAGGSLLALLAALPVGVSCVVDQIENRRAHLAAAAITYTFTAAVFVASILAR